MRSVHDEIRALYGSVELVREGVVHVVHAVRAGDGFLHPLRIGPDSPHSPSDLFILNLCRARADVVLTSAENLRREPKLSHEFSSPFAPQLADYRAFELAKKAPLTCAILTRSGELPRDHPVWSDGTTKLVLTTPDRKTPLAAALGARATVVGLAELDARRAISWLRERGAQLISLEAGPTTARTLYEPHLFTGRPRDLPDQHGKAALRSQSALPRQAWRSAPNDSGEPPARVSELLLTEWLPRSPFTASASATLEVQLAAALPCDELLFAGLSLRGQTEREERGQHFRFSRWA